MRALLGARYTEFADAVQNKPRHKALRVNTLKISVEDLVGLKGEMRQNALCAQSFYYNGKPSLDPYYHAGLYYMQEPSAAAAVAALSPYIGERVLDLCAAPGGKSTQAAAFMRGGVIFCNDVEYKRISALCDNVSRLGATNAVTTCSSAQGYRAAGFDGYFDTLIVDAPCSGGGMMRYETVPYSEDIVRGCAARQKKILDDAVELLCRGGYMLYSTCTFSREENEDNVNYILQKGFETVDIPLVSGTERGVGVADARRIYPHNFDGEGHFYCVLKKIGGKTRNELPAQKFKSKLYRLGDAHLDAKVTERGLESIEFVLPKTQFARGFNIISAGVRVEINGEPSYALSHALTREQAEKVGVAELGELAERYIRGEQIDMESPRGLKVATVDGYALGFARSAATGDGSSALKNLYPKSLRI